MKRDMDLVRSILLMIEESPKARADHFQIDGFSDDVVDYHIQMLVSAGYLKDPKVGGSMRIFAGHALTWEGHEFLDTIRDPKIWRQTKSGASKIGGWTAGMLKDIAIGYIKQEAAAKLGFSI